MEKRIEKNCFGIWDYPLLVDYLESMAQDGWMLTDYHEKTLEFAAAEPKKVKFAVTFFREYNFGGNTPPEDLVYMWKMCETDGWHNVTYNSYIQIFYNEDENCVPFHTDAVVQLANFDRLMQNSLLKRWRFCAAALLTFVLVRGMKDLYAFYTAQLVPAEAYSILAFMIPVGAYLVYEVLYNFFRKIKYQQWYRQAVVIAEEKNEFMAPFENNFYDGLNFAVTVVFCTVFVILIFVVGCKGESIFGTENGPLYALDYIYIFIFSRIISSLKVSRLEDEGEILPVREKYPSNKVLFVMYIMIFIYIMSFSAHIPRFFSNVSG